MRSLNSLIWRNLSAHGLRSILTILAIMLGVAMVLAASIVGQAASKSAAQLSQQRPVADLHLFSRGDTPLQETTLDTLRSFPGIDRLSPSLRVQAALVPDAVGLSQGEIPKHIPLSLIGVEPRVFADLHRPRLADGAFLDRPDTIVMPMQITTQYGWHIGDQVMLIAPEDKQETLPTGQTMTLTISGRIEFKQSITALADETVAYIPLPVAQRLAGLLGQIDQVDIVLDSGLDVNRIKTKLEKQLGSEIVLARAIAGEGVMGNVLLVQAGLAIVGLIILFAAGFVILNAFAMSITGRRQEIGALRALGMTRRQILITVLIEAGLLGSVGTATGLLIGLGLARGVMLIMGTLQDIPFDAPWWGVTVSALMGLAVTMIAALQPARQASRISPITAIRSEATASAGWYVRAGGRAGIWLSTFLLIGLIAYGLLGRPNIATALPVMVIGQATLLGAAVLLLPALIAPLTTVCRPVLVRWLGTAGRLAADNLARNKLRTVLTAGALTAGLTIIVATSGLMTAGLKGAVSRVRSASGNEDRFITADLAELVASQGMTVDNFFSVLTSDDLGFDLNPVIDALDPLVASGEIELIRYRFQTVPPELSTMPGVPGLFVDPELYIGIDNFDFFEGDPKTALAWMLRGRAMLLTPIVAEQLNARVGDNVVVQTSQGEIPFTVAGIGGGGFLMTVLSYADGETYFEVTKPSFLGVVVSERKNLEEALAQVKNAIAPFPEITLLDYSESLDPVVDMIGRLELLLDGLLMLSVIVAALGVVNTMVINVTERRREIGLLRAVGATQRQVRRSVMAEAALVGLLAAVVASMLGLLMLLTYGVLVLPNGTASVGVRADWETIRLTIGAGLRDWGLAAIVSLLFGPLVAAWAAYYPAKQAASMDVVEATRSEQVALG